MTAEKKVSVEAVEGSGLPSSWVAEFGETFKDMARSSQIKRRHDKPSWELSPADRHTELARNTSHGVVLTDTSGSIKWVNQGFTELTGFSEDEAIGKHFTAFPLEWKTNSVRNVLKNLCKKGRSSVEVRMVKKEEQTTWFSLEVTSLRSSQGRLTGYGAFLVDITRLHQAIERLREQIDHSNFLAEELLHEKAVLSSIINNVPHAIFWKDWHGRYLGCNQAIADAAGRATPEQLVGLTDYDMPWTDQADWYTECDRKVMSTGQPMFDIAEIITHPDGSQSHLLTSKVPLRNKHDEIEGVVGIFADVTHIKDLERDLAQARRLESIGQLAAGIAHEINTPTQYVTDNTRFLQDSFSELLRPLHVLREVLDSTPESIDAEQIARLTDALQEAELGYLEEEVPTALEQSLEGLSRIANIVGAMKSFSHPQDQITEADINEVIENTIIVARNEWKYVAEVETDLDQDMGPIPCYVSELKQAILNLIVNAAHAIEESLEEGSGDKGVISVKTRRGEDAVEIYIADTGCGIPAENLHRVFEPFFTTKDVGKGTGQGLSIVHAVIVKKHGGTIDVKSQVGHGASFTIKLPVGGTAESEQQKKAAIAS